MGSLEATFAPYAWLISDNIFHQIPRVRNSSRDSIAISGKFLGKCRVDWARKDFLSSIKLKRQPLYRNFRRF